MILTEAENDYIQSLLSEAKLPPDLEKQFRAELSQAFGETPTMHQTDDSVFMASLNPHYKEVRGQGRYRVTHLVKNTPEFRQSVKPDIYKGMEDSPFIPVFHASFTSPQDVASTMKKISSLPKNMPHTQSSIQLWGADKSFFNPKIDPATDIEESVEGFFSSSHPTYQYDSFESLWPRMSSRKIRKLATVMAGSTGAGVP